ncbi:PP-loop family-domain-containing protein [Lenzites betulinus]|nr:PP-loop family-domain-containing protein [Lenzites betulinus]
MPAYIPPITPTEFFHHLQRCIPPTGWRNRIVVANSGGPDSTALLYLLTAVVELRKSSHCFPRAVASVHVNHSLQDAATLMEETALQTAKRANVPHVIESIPWGTLPYPQRQEVDEKVAREARYSRLFHAMRTFKANTIAFAHHADDQVETAIMRMSQGSGIRGLAGMRPVRRWGMGNKENDYYAFGLPGMRSWLIRPFLHVSKDRILATCEHYQLNYAIDPTNFQPDLTFRNDVRHVLSGKSSPPRQKAESASHSKGIDIEPYVEQLRAMVSETRPADQLREAVRLYGIRLEEVDAQVTNALSRIRVRSPPSTLLLTSPALQEITDDEVRAALIRRCLRYISHGPWGSAWSEAGGDRTILRRIASQLWPADPAPPARMAVDPQTGAREDPRRTFTAGAGVIVYPVTVNVQLGTIVHRGSMPGRAEEVPGWMFARAPPHAKAVSLNADAYGVLDVTEELLKARAMGRPTYTALYDYRFAVHFDVAWPGKYIEDAVFSKKGRVTIVPDTKWVLPQVVVGAGSDDSTCVGKFLWQLPEWKDSCRRPVRHQSWVRMEFVRKLDAI